MVVRVDSGAGNKKHVRPENAHEHPESEIEQQKKKKKRTAGKRFR
jgi:hypothetical protein